MDFEYPPESAAFRSEVRTWLEENLPADLRGWTMRVPLGPDLFEHLRAWSRELAEAGLAAIGWPPEHGGRGAGPVDQLVLAEELAAARAPAQLNPIGLNNVAPSIMAAGTEAQLAQHLRPILRADEIWCQGFSEPGAGSDLAAIATKAIVDGDDFVVTGSKVWTTLAEFADWCALLVRTDPAAPRHHGLSMLLVDMASPGIEARPLRTMTGGKEFGVLFFDSVRVPRENLLGPLHGGWRVAMTTLGYERAGVANLHLRVRGKLDRLVADAHALGDTGAAVRAQIVACHVDVELLRLLALRAITTAVQGRPPGPETSLAKLVWTRAELRLGAAATAVWGARVSAEGDGWWAREICSAPSTGLAGGTSEVQRNIVAERLLGLPPEPHNR